MLKIIKGNVNIMLVLALVFNLFTVVAKCSVFDEDLYQHVLDPELCNQQMNMLLNDTEVALKFLDASGRIPSGFMTGNLNDLGEYHECLSIDAVLNQTDAGGKYCLLNFPIDLGGLGSTSFLRHRSLEDQMAEKYKINAVLQKMASHFLGNNLFMGNENRRGGRAMPVDNARGLQIGVCVPKPCTAKQVIDFLIGRLPPLNNITYSESYCRLPNDKPWATVDIITTVVFAILGLLTIVSTSYDLYHTFVLKSKSSDTVAIYRSFSLYTNTRRFITVSSPPGALECVDGIRTIAMLWVIVGHSFTGALINTHNYMDVFQWIQSFSSIWLTSAPITVDTFFLLSGVLCVYTTIGKVDKWTFLKNIHLFYLNRLLRMFPLLAIMILLQASWFNHLSDGPLWVIPGWTTQACRENWWPAMLHIQNYYKVNSMCLVQTWYLSVDVQLYIVCPIVLVWLFGSKRVAWLALSAAILATLIFTTTYGFFYNFPATMLNVKRVAGDSSADYNKKYYMNTLTRASPFAVGMAFGYLLHLRRKKKICISRKLNLTLWVLSLAIMSFVIFSVHPVTQADHDNQMLDNFLNAYMRGLWALALGWLIVACHHGYGGPINWFLSLQVWKLPARLSYAMYLVHFSVILLAAGSWVKPNYFTVGSSLYRFMADLVCTTLGSLFLCITVDAPFSTLQKLLLRGGRRRQGT